MFEAVRVAWLEAGVGTELRVGGGRGPVLASPQKIAQDKALFERLMEESGNEAPGRRLVSLPPRQ